MIDAWLTPLAAPDRMASLARYDLFNPGLRRRLDAISRRTATSMRMSTGVVSIVLDTAQYYAGSYGVTGWIAAAEGTPVEWAFCAHAVLSGRPTYVVSDAEADPRHRDSPLVAREGTRTYAGAAIVGTDGHILGMHCVTGTRPRRFAETELAILVRAAGEVAEVLAEYPARMS